MERSSNKFCLIGMAGVGKTFWSQQLEETGLHRVSCDELIAQSLMADSLIDAADYSSLCDWLNYPWNENFRSHEKQYSDAEDRIMREIIAEAPDQDTVLDATGSVLYCDIEILKLLTDNYKVIYLQLSEEEKTLFQEKYIETPRPIVWNHHAEPLLGSKPDDEVIATQYIKLVKEREGRYMALADQVVPSAVLSIMQSGEELLRLISDD